MCFSSSLRESYTSEDEVESESECDCKRMKICLRASRESYVKVSLTVKM